MKLSARLIGAAGCAAVVSLVAAAAAQSQQSAVPDYITGVVQSNQGLEAGVWVIAETSDLPTNFIKIVVTDDRGRFALPQLPNTNYRVWVRGYGLIDSAPVKTKPCAQSGSAIDLGFA